MFKRLLMSFFFLLSFSSQASFEGRNPSEYNLATDKLAVQGYDVVSYFPEGGEAPVLGQKTFEIDHEGIIYRFVNSENMNVFLSNPNKYEPTYGGWCGTAMAFGQKVSIDPLKYVVNGNRLTLFANYGDGTDASIAWKKRPKSYEKRADARWKRISGEQARK